MARCSELVVMPLCVCVLLLPRHWLAVEYIWVLVPYMTYDIYVMYLCHWHKSQERGILEKKHSLASVWSFLLQERLMVTHHLFILIVLTPITQVRAAAGPPGHAGCWLLSAGPCAQCCLSLQHFRGELGDFFVGCIFTAELSTPFVSLGKILMQVGEEGRDSGLGSPQQFIPFPLAPSAPLQAVAELGGVSERGNPTV